jgi:hypothetical protein
LLLTYNIFGISAGIGFFAGFFLILKVKYSIYL